MDSKRWAAPISASNPMDCPQAAGRERLFMAETGPSKLCAGPDVAQASTWRKHPGSGAVPHLSQALLDCAENVPGYGWKAMWQASQVVDL
jgi:hypothetical protein